MSIYSWVSYSQTFIEQTPTANDGVTAQYNLIAKYRFHRIGVKNMELIFYVRNFAWFCLSGSAFRECSLHVEDNKNRPLG